MLKQKLKSCLQNERGMALVMVLVVSTALALVGTSYLSTSVHEAGLVTERIKTVQALNCAETGAAYARNQLKTSANWTNTDWTGDISDGAGATATVAFAYDEANNLGTLTSSCGQQQVTLSVSRIGPSPFTQAACGCEDVEVENNGYVNSYDGSMIYSESTATNEGNIASNNDIELENNAKVYGNIVAVGTLDDMNNSYVSGTVTTGQISTLSGTIIGTVTQGVSVLPPCDCTSIDLGSLIPAAKITNNNSNVSAYLNSLMCHGYGTDFSVPNNTEMTIPAGTYYFTSFTVGNNAIINIPTTGQVIIYMDSSTLNGVFDMSNGGTINTSDNTSNLRVYSNYDPDILEIETDDGVVIKNNAQFSGTIYAPGSEVELENNAHVYGAIIAKEAEIENNAGLHYDTTLPAQGEPVGGGGGTVTVQSNSWSQN